MDLNIILFIIGILVIVFLIFKLIKKLILAVFTVIFFIIIVIGTVFGLVYLDFKQLSTQTDFDTYLIYEQNDNPEFGISLPIQNQEIQTENIEKLSDDTLSNLKITEIEKDDNLIVILVNSEFYKERIMNKTFSLNEFEGLGEDFNDFTLELSGNDILSLIESNNAEEEIANLLIEKNSIPKLLQPTAKSLISSAITSVLETNNLGVKELLFGFTITQLSQDEKEILFLAQGFKEDNIQIYPERITFKLIRMLPLSMIADNLPSQQVSQ